MDELSSSVRDHLEALCTSYPDRHVGGPGNRAANELFARVASECGFEVTSADLDCVEWRRGSSSVATPSGEPFALHTGPYSLPVEATARLTVVSTVEELEAGDFSGTVLLLTGEIVGEQLMPKRFPFYNPDSHRRIVAAIEAADPVAIVAATAKNPELAGGVYPFPLVEDGDFDIPNAYTTDVEGERLRAHVGESVTIRIDSGRIPASAVQLVARKPGRKPGRVLLFAHIDSKDGTPGALDNASGVAVLLGAMQLLAAESPEFTVEVVPLNGEDYYAASGQKRYLADNPDGFGDVVLCLNVDGAGFVGAAAAVSLYGVPADVEAVVRGQMRRHGLAEGPPWYQGDHSILVMQGVPAVAVTSENVFFVSTTLAHTPDDTADKVDPVAVAAVARFFADVTRELAAPSG